MCFFSFTWRISIYFQTCCEDGGLGVQAFGAQGHLGRVLSPPVCFLRETRCASVSSSRPRGDTMGGHHAVCARALAAALPTRQDPLATRFCSCVLPAHVRGAVTEDGVTETFPCALPACGSPGAVGSQEAGNVPSVGTRRGVHVRSVRREAALSPPAPLSPSAAATTAAHPARVSPALPSPPAPSSARGSEPQTHCGVLAHHVSPPQTSWSELPSPLLPLGSKLRGDTSENPRPS